MNTNKVTLTAKMKPIDWENIEIVKDYYRNERGMDLKDSSVVKMLLADKVAELKASKGI